MGWGFGDREYLQMTKFELSVATGEDGDKIGAGAENRAVVGDELMVRSYGCGGCGY